MEKRDIYKKDFSRCNIELLNFNSHIVSKVKFSM